MKKKIVCMYTRIDMCHGHYPHSSRKSGKKYRRCRKKLSKLAKKCGKKIQSWKKHEKKNRVMNLIV